MKFRVIIIFVLLFSGIVPAAYAEGPDSIAVPVWSYTLRDRITAMDCSDDGRSSIAGTQSGKVWFFSPDGKVIWTFERPEKSVMAVSVSGDGEYSAAAFFDPLASSSDAGGEIVYFNRTGSFLWSYPTRSTVHRLAVSGNGSTVFGSGDSLIYSFDRDGELRGKYRASGTIWGIASADDGSIGAAGSLYPGPRLTVFGNNASLLWNFSYGTNNVAVSSDGGTIASAGYSHLYLHDRNGTLLWQFNSSPEFSGVALSSGGEYCAATSQYYVRYFNRTGSLLWKHEVDGYTNDVAVSENGDSVIAGIPGRTVLYDKAGGTLWSYGRSSPFVCAAKDGNRFVVVTNGTVSLFNRAGDTILPDEPEESVGAGSTPATTAEPPQPTSQPTPPSAFLPVVAMCLVVISGLSRRF